MTAPLVLRSDLDGGRKPDLEPPDVLNALSPPLLEELRAHVEAIASQTDTVGCVVLAGAGRSSR